MRDIPADGDALMHALIAAGGHDPEFLTDAMLAAAPLRIAVADYLDWYRTLPAKLTEAIERQWGAPPGDRYLDGDDLVVAGLELGDVFVLIQPPRGYGDNLVGIYHDPELAPAHHYLAAYRWLDRHWGADAVVHLGKHGTLEWLPGKMLALSASCAPDAALGSMPLVYPFVVNDPGEGAQAKRRAHALIIDHLVPPMMRAESYDELAELEALIDEYARLEVLDPAKLPGLGARIWAAIEQANLQEELGIERQPGDAGKLVEHLDGYLCEVKDVQIKDGLHVLGVVPEGAQLRGLVAAIGRHGAGEIPGLRRALAATFGLDEPALVAAPGVKVAAERSAELIARFPGSAHRGSDLLDRLEEAHHALLAELSEHGWDPDRAAPVCRSLLGRDDAGVVAALRFAAGEIVPRLRRTTDELTNVVRALRGRHIAAGPSGAPTRGRLDVLPTGRNFYSVDPRALPSELSYATGVKLADALLERHVADTGALPEMVGLVAWGTAAMRTQGDDAAEVFALLGVRPAWHEASRRVTGLEPISLERLGRPRIDVTLRISGFFRDAFPHLIGLLDDAVSLVAGLDEPDEHNFVAKHARAEAARLAGELDAAEAWRRSTTRIFGSKPGTYGAGLSELLDTREWRGFAYGRELDGVAAAAAMRACFGQIDVAVKNVDSREHDHLDSDDYAQYHGGMIATIRSLSGRDPEAYLGDSADPERVTVRTLAEQTRRVFRARVANPHWIGSMVRHGFKGAAELAATVDYLFGYDATTDVASDWMYEQVAAKYLLDEAVATFMDQANPWARAQHRRAAAGSGVARHVERAGRADGRRDRGALPRAPGRARGRRRLMARGGRDPFPLRDRRPGGSRGCAARMRRAPGRRRRARARRARDGEVDRRTRAGADAERDRPARRAAARRDARPARRDARPARRAGGEHRVDAGLLGRADGGVLYVDEVNLLGDHLVDVLLDAAATGEVVVERDGVSVVQDARFLLVGTMNPEEGELRPQLLDRFGLGVEVTGPRDVATRARIVRRRMDFDAAPAAFAAAWADSERTLAGRIAAARALVGSVTIAERELLRIPAVCARLELDGVRGDLVCAHAACALAALDGETQVAAAHVERAAHLALRHRLRRDPLAPPPDGGRERAIEQALGASGRGPEAGDDDGPSDRDPAGDDGRAGSVAGGRGRSARPPQFVSPAPLPSRLPETALRLQRGRSAAARALVPGGRVPGGTIAVMDARPAAPGDPVAIIPTILASLRGDERPQTAIRGGGRSAVLCLIVDTSGSMAAQRRLARVKGALEATLRRAYARRDLVAVVAFSGERGRTLVRPGAPLEQAAATARELPAGGRTPLAAGIAHAAELLESLARSQLAGRARIAVLLTDGRAPDPHGAARAALARVVAAADRAVVVDLEEGRVRLGLAAELAAAAGADLTRLVTPDAAEPRRPRAARAAASETAEPGRRSAA